jgi:diguanylate cyclase (GGDEF)-like protein/PAS domain S-box-containing protein
MAWLWKRAEKAGGRHRLPIVVCALGLALSTYAGVERAQRSDLEQLRQLQAGARNYESLLQHRLDQYVSASRALGAFFSASSEVAPEEFDHYLRISRGFERLPGINSFGYLPRVPAAQAAAFEAEAGRRFPGYRIVQRREGADAYFPLLYGQHRADPLRAGQLRGIDFSATPERRDAMLEADQRDEPVATRLHGALRDPDQRAVVLIFSPVRKARSGAAMGELNGFIFSALYVDRLFLNVDGGLLARHFDLEVFQDRVAPDNIVFGGDRRPAAASPRVLAHRAEVQFAHRTWLVHFYAKDADLAPGLPGAGAVAFALGLLLTLIATYAAAAWPRRLLRKQARLGFQEQVAGFENHPFAFYALDPERRFIYVNLQMAKELGMPREALIGTTDERFIASDQRAEAAGHFKQVLAGNAVAYTTRIAAAGGRGSDLSVVLIPMRAGDAVSHVLGFAENISDRKNAESALYESRQMLQLILDNIPQSVFWKDIDSVYVGANWTFLNEAGLPSIDHLIGKTDADLRWKGMAELYRQVDVDVMRSSIARMRMQAADTRRDGTECWIETSKIPLKDGKGRVVGVLAVTEDITARKYMEQELFRRANFDSLTALPNREYFQSRLDEAVKRALRRNGLALMYFDIDHFKQINDTYGHDAGDKVIRMFAQRIRSVMRESDFMARVGGDEFVLITEGLNGQNDAALIAQKLVEAMAPPFNLVGTVLQVTTSIGVAYFEAGMTPERLVKAADQAMYDAKRAGRNCFRQALGGALLATEGNKPE